MKDKNGHTLTIAVWFPVSSGYHLSTPSLTYFTPLQRYKTYEARMPELIAKQVLCQVQSKEGSGERWEGERKEATISFLLLDGVRQHAASLSVLLWSNVGSTGQ